MSWVNRKTITYKLDNLPCDDLGKIAIIDPSIIRAEIPGYVYPVDIGSWCYSKRRRLSHNTLSEECAKFEVYSPSFRPQRKMLIQGYLEHLANHSLLGKSPKSLLTSVGQFQQFVYWCDREKVEALDSKESYVISVNQYTEEMIQKIRTSQLNINTAASLQLIILSVGRAIYNDPYLDLFRFVRPIRRSLNAVNKTTVPDEVKAQKAIKIYLQLFHQLTDFVVKNEQFPKKLNIEDSFFWFFPCSIPFGGPKTISKKVAFKSRYLAYDYLNGKIRNESEIRKRSKSSNKELHKQSIAEANKNLNNGNSHHFHRRRVEAATLAFQAFIMLFSANTAMNLGQLVSLPWIDKYEMVNERQGFKGIKYRADGREVTFFISSNFVSLFKKFLTLRRYILKARGQSSFPYLFFRLVNGLPRECGMNISTDFHNRLKNCFDFNIKITTRMWRAFKGDWLIRHTDVNTTATILQNSPATVLKHYSEGSEFTTEKELSTFFSEYKKKLIITKSSNTQSLAIGQCENQKPIPLPNAPIAPDCTSFEGCLFCNKYRVHADFEDIKKLASFKYILELSEPIAHDSNHYNLMVSPLIIRINEVLEQIYETAKFSKVEFEDALDDVYKNENLSPYWSHKLNLLEDIGGIL